MIRRDQTPCAAHQANFVFLFDLDEHRLGVHIMPSLYKAQMGGRLAHTNWKFLGQGLGPGISAAPLDRDFEQVRSKGNGSAPHSEKGTYPQQVVLFCGWRGDPSGLLAVGPMRSLPPLASPPAQVTHQP